MENVILVGMPGSGKSTIGVVLAKVLGYEFLDTDLVIQKQEKRKLSEIIASTGTEGFLAIENNVIKSLNVDRTVIATGGSAIYGEEGMEHVKQIGKVIYLKIDFERLRRRLGNLKARGVVLKEGQTFLQLYNERVPLYEKYADVVIDEKEKEIREIVDEIAEILTK